MKYLTGMILLITVAVACGTSSPPVDQGQLASTPTALPVAVTPIPTVRIVPTPTPSPTRTATATASSTPSPTSSPTATRSATPSPTASPVPSPTTTNTPKPTATPLPTKTPTPTYTPAPTNTRLPTVVPTATRGILSNLVPFAPPGWEARIVVAKLGVKSSRKPRNSELTVGGDAFVSWAVGNEGPLGVNKSFFVDLLFDDMIVSRWSAKDIPINGWIFIEDWAKLPGNVNIDAGLHTLALLVDSTNLIAETDETDNRYEAKFRWKPSKTEFRDSGALAERLPDLVPFGRPEWDEPLIVSSYVEANQSGPLSVNVTPLISFGFKNVGLSSTDRDFWVQVFVDDVMVRRTIWRGARVDGFGILNGFDRLYETTPIEPGAHVVKVVVDATNMVDELDESNNTFEREIVWDVGPVPPGPVPTPSPAPVAPDPPIYPNLVPGWKFGTDGPIVAAQIKDTPLDDNLVVGDQPFIDVTISNDSFVATSSTVFVDLYFDGERVHTFESSGKFQGGEILYWEDWDDLPNLVEIDPGPHTMRIVIDPDNLVVEQNEDDNEFEKVFEWSPENQPESPPVIYTEEELRSMLSGLGPLLDDRTIVVDQTSSDLVESVMTVVDATYFLITGTSLKDERVDIQLLSKADYLAWIDADFDDTFAITEPSNYASLLRRREKTKRTAVGITTRSHGKISVVVNAEMEPAEVISTLAHEMGHMRQNILNPAQSDSGEFYNLSGLHEAQAQQFERVFWLTLEEFTGLDLMSYPDFETFRSVVTSRQNKWFTDIDPDEHFLGYVIQWVAALGDPNLLELRKRLLAEGELDLADSLELFEYLANINAEDVESYVEERLRSQLLYVDTIRELTVGRLAPMLDADLEGRPALINPALLAP